MTLNIDEAIQYLQRKGVLEPGKQNAVPVKGTTEGQVFIIHIAGRPRFVLKADTPSNIDETSQFLSRYSASPLLPQLLYVHPEQRYCLYEYKHGTTHINRGRKSAWMVRLVTDLLNLYTPAEVVQCYGRPEWPNASWREFTHGSLEFAKDRIGDKLAAKDHDIIRKLWETKLRDWGTERLYWLHGDTGVHNFVFHNGEMAGVIDPSPIAGPVLYDFTYAFCSSPDDLDFETLVIGYEALSDKTVDRRELVNETVFQLYCRLAICLLHHPDDFPAYMKAWPRWLSLLEQAGQLGDN